MTINEPWASGLGAIYSQNGIVVEKLLVNSSGYGIIDQEFETQTLLEHVGRSLTIHQVCAGTLCFHAHPRELPFVHSPDAIPAHRIPCQGGESSTPTIAVAVCGLAHPHAKLDTSNAASVYALSGRMIAMIVVWYAWSRPPVSPCHGSSATAATALSISDVPASLTIHSRRVCISCSVGSILVCVAVLIYVVHKKCVRLPCLPSGGMHFSEVPPPPPPPYAGGVEMAGNKA